MTDLTHFDFQTLAAMHNGIVLHVLTVHTCKQNTTPIYSKDSVLHIHNVQM